MAIIKGTSGPDLLPLQSLLGILSPEDDSVFGYEGVDLLIGGAGNDMLEGGAGADIIIGGTLGVILNVGTINISGNDTASYAASSAAVTVNLGNMQDLNLTLLGINLGLQHAVIGHGGNAEGDLLIGMSNLTGSAFADYLTGDIGANIINGGAGVDIMAGGLGNDTFYVDNAGDRVNEAVGGGVDTIFTAVSYAPGFDQEIEKIAITNSATTDSLNLTGNAFNQTLMGNNGDNMLNGGSGVDKMYGFGGNDTYFVDHSMDQVFDTAGTGADRVFSSANWALGAGQRVESILVADPAGTTRINLNGNEFAQTLTGSAGSNVLNGGGGNDVLFGLGGGDRIYGGLGNDMLTGGTGNDLFVFDTRPDGMGNHDVITDFGNVGGNNDEIYLENAIFTMLRAGPLGPDAFIANATGVATDAEDRIIYNSTTGDLFYDVNGSGAGGSTLFATLNGNPAITASDFVVI